MTTTNAHELKNSLTEVEEIPTHIERKGESSTFLANVKRLKADGHYKCWICGGTEDIQIHHLIAEWCLSNSIDMTKLMDVACVFDPYGYSKTVTGAIESVDDIRNLMALCQKHHTGKIEGIHETTFSAWISQRIAKDGVEIVPQDHNKAETESGNPTPNTGGGD